MRFLIACLLTILSGFLVSASAAPSFEDYTLNPSFRSAALSPSGSRVAYIMRLKDDELLCVYEATEDKSDCYARVTDIKAGSVGFVSEDVVVLLASETTRMIGFRGRFENSAAFAIDLKTKKIKQLLLGSDDLFPAQGGLGRIIAVSPDRKHVYMPAFIGEPYTEPGYGFMKVNLKTGRGRKVQRGTSKTVDWFVSPEGEPLAREKFDGNKDEHTIESYIDDRWRDIFVDETNIPRIAVVGVDAKLENLVLVDEDSSGEDQAIYLMNLQTGDIEDSVFLKEGHQIDRLLLDQNRVLLGVQYTGLTPSYALFDKELEADIKEIVNEFQMISVQLINWTTDRNRLLFHMSGSGFAPRYILYDRRSEDYTIVASTRPNIRDDDLGEVVIIEYQARDGRIIPAVMTWPVGTNDETREKLPIIVFPHGGPTGYDKISFDWMAQLFASEGYLVLQPNFRGSTGFGREHRYAGHGEWGRAMQDDVTDGLQALVDMGWADPDRVCIVGASYGGYAALAGGALTPDRYNCVVAIAPVTDLIKWLKTAKRSEGRYGWIHEYWSMLIGDRKEDESSIKAVSPYHQASKFEAPVLLIHGKDDLIVPIDQSKRMDRALRNAGKSVEFITHKELDHWLSLEEERVETMQAVISFVNEHIGEE